LDLDLDLGVGLGLGAAPLADAISPADAISLADAIGLVDAISPADAADAIEAIDAIEATDAAQRLEGIVRSVMRRRGQQHDMTAMTREQIGCRQPVGAFVEVVCFVDDEEVAEESAGAAQHRWLLDEIERDDQDAGQAPWIDVRRELARARGERRGVDDV